MYKILTKKILNPTVTLMEVDAPMIAKKAEPGQFIILRVDAEGERIPLTIADFDREKGTITIIFQIVGATTEKLNHSSGISWAVCSGCSGGYITTRQNSAGNTEFNSEFGIRNSEFWCPLRGLISNAGLLSVSWEAYCHRNGFSPRY